MGLQIFETQVRSCSADAVEVALSASATLAQRQLDQPRGILLEHPRERRLGESGLSQHLRRLCESVGMIRRASQAAVAGDERQLGADESNGVEYPVRIGRCSRKIARDDFHECTERSG